MSLIVSTSGSVFLPSETASRATEDAVPEPGDTEVREPADELIVTYPCSSHSTGRYRIDA